MLRQRRSPASQKNMCSHWPPLPSNAQVVLSGNAHHAAPETPGGNAVAVGPGGAVAAAAAAAEQQHPLRLYWEYLSFLFRCVAAALLQHKVFPLSLRNGLAVRMPVLPWQEAAGILCRPTRPPLLPTLVPSPCCTAPQEAAGQQRAGAGGDGLPRLPAGAQGCTAQ